MRLPKDREEIDKLLMHARKHEVYELEKARTS